MEHTFWTALDKLVEQSEIIIDRPKGSVHPGHPDFIYQVDYGFLRNTSSMDREGIDIWAGSDHTAGIDAILCTVDLLKRDSEIKILLDCTGGRKEADIQSPQRYLVYEGHLNTPNRRDFL
ncbi:MAG: inorganic pyrophosphatase [Enterocloster sp.]